MWDKGKFTLHFNSAQNNSKNIFGISARITQKERESDGKKAGRNIREWDEDWKVDELCFDIWREVKVRRKVGCEIL